MKSYILQAYMTALNIRYLWNFKFAEKSSYVIGKMREQRIFQDHNAVVPNLFGLSPPLQVRASSSPPLIFFLETAHFFVIHIPICGHFLPFFTSPGPLARLPWGGEPPWLGTAVTKGRKGPGANGDLGPFYSNIPCP